MPAIRNHYSGRVFCTIVLFCLASVQLIAQDGGSGSDFPAIYNSEPSEASPMEPASVVSNIQLPAGFAANVFASEPDVQNPIGMNWDQHGRLWVAENYTYAERGKGFDLELRDRVIILEDRDQDGVAETRRVFSDNLQRLTSVEVGQGGVWMMCPPYLLFVPDSDEDGVPDGPARVVLDGFDVGKDNYHNFANGLKWGPDGWLYGRVGHSCPGNVGPPGTALLDRIPIDGGIWRYSPKTNVFEALCHGTVNPWGHDWDANGELFFVNTVIGHLWHMVHGAHFIESFGESSNPRIYERLDMIADHYHFDVNGSWTESRDGKANEFGGGHAHSGAAICLENRWPSQLQGRLFTVNLHGLRANVERLERESSGYVGKHEPDLFIVPDPFFRGIDLNFGPDGALYVCDWSDTGECHDSTGVHRTSGRIYRIIPNAEDGTPDAPFTKPACLAGSGALVKLWNDYQAGMLDRDDLLNGLLHEDEHYRVWTIRLLSDHWPLDTLMGPRKKITYPMECEQIVQAFARHSQNETSGLVLSAYASCLQRLPLHCRILLAEKLVQHDAYANDMRLQNLVWYGLAPAVDQFGNELTAILVHTKWHRLQKHIARAIAETASSSIEPLQALLAVAPKLETMELNAVLEGLTLGFQGAKRVGLGNLWKQFSNDIAERSDDQLRRNLDAFMGNGHAIEDLVALVQNAELEMKVRQQSLETLINLDYHDLETLCLKLLDVRILNATAVQGLMRFDSQDVGTRIAKNYRKFQPEDRRLVLQLLCTRTSFAMALLEVLALQNSPIPIDDLKPQNRWQIKMLDNANLNQQLARVWGDSRETLPNHQQKIDQFKEKLAANASLKVDLALGRRVYEANCSQCHKLYGAGTSIGPDLTGSQRSDLDYLLTNIIDPSASVGKDFRATLIRTEDGRTLSGLVVRENEHTLLLQVGNSQQLLDQSEIAERMQTELSAMPEGLLDSLTFEQVHALMEYLKHPVQVSLPE